MHDTELKDLLLKTHPVRPGQEERAWSLLKTRLSPASQSNQNSFFLSWSGAFTTCLIIGVILAIGVVIPLRFHQIPFASATSQSPVIYATAFYSHSAQAQVVWLNGLGPASDKLSYLDPTTVINDGSTSETSQSTNDPNSL